MPSLRVFTLSNGRVDAGAVVEQFKLTAGSVIPAILVGEQGRGRELGVLPVHLLPEQYREWQEKGSTTIHYAEVSQTKSGKPKLVQREQSDTDDAIITVCRTRFGFRGGCEHTGDRVDEPCPNNGKWMFPDWRGQCDLCHTSIDDQPADGARRLHPEGKMHITFLPCPLEVLVEGRCADGEAGRMASGPQVIGILPRGQVLRTGYWGRLYGKPPSHYYLWDGAQLLVATWEERQLADLF